MRLLLGLLLGPSASSAYRFFDGRQHTDPTVLRVVKGFKQPRFSAVQRADSLRADAEAKLQKNANEKMEAGR